MKPLKAVTYQTDNKELAAMKANCAVASRHVLMGQKFVLEHTAITTANGQLECKLWTCVRENNCLYLLVAIVHIILDRRYENTHIFECSGKMTKLVR